MSKREKDSKRNVPEQSSVPEKEGGVRPTSDQGLDDALKEKIGAYWEDGRETKRHHGYRAEEIEKPQNVKKKKPTLKKVLLLILFIIIVFIAVAAITFLVLQRNGKKQLLEKNAANTQISAAEGADSSDEGKTVVYKGQKYCYNENITTILWMGIDEESFQNDDKFRQGSFADSVFLMVIDTSTGKMTMIPISRYTMVTIDEYHPDGSYWKQEDIQVCFAYAYGDGRKSSCENMATAISRFMYGMPISSYMAIDMSAIGVLNDAVGGVPVDVIEDLTLSDPELYVGNHVTLMGQQAELYVRSRKSEGYDLKVDNNAPRMERQIQYMNAFMKKALSQTKQNPTLPVSLFRTASDYMVTDVNASEVTYLASLLVQHGLDNTIVSIPGKAKKGKYTEVYADDEKLYEIILDVFYKKVD